MAAQHFTLLTINTIRHSINTLRLTFALEEEYPVLTNII